jgi:hypothetical protein
MPPVAPPVPVPPVLVLPVAPPVPLVEDDDEEVEAPVPGSELHATVATASEAITKARRG